MIQRIKLIGATRREKALGALALLILLLLIGKNSVVLPHWERWIHLQEHIQQQEGLYTRYLRIYDQREGIENAYKKNRVTIEKIEGKIFTGHDIHVTAAKLQKVIQELAKDNHIRIRRTQTEKPVQISGGLYVITLGVFGEARTMGDVNRFLEHLEHHQKKYLYAPRLYLKNIRKRLNLEIQVFSIAMID